MSVISSAPISGIPNVVRGCHLSSVEKAELDRRETAIRKGIRTAFEVGGHLKAIRDGRLYRDHYERWEDYCVERWGFSGRAANRFVQGHEIAEGLAEGDDPDAVKPERESQVRPLASVPEADRAAVWAEAVESAGGGQPTAAQVKAAADRAAGPIGPVDEPYDVAAMRAEGLIPEGATVQVIEEEGDPEPIDEPGNVLTEEEWLKTLPARGHLSDEARVWFDAEALAYRRCSPIRDQYRAECRAFVVQAKRDGKHIGPWLYLHNRYLSEPAPESWTACDECNGTATVGLIGKCPACRGNGYHTYRGGN